MTAESNYQNEINVHKFYDLALVLSFFLPILYRKKYTMVKNLDFAVIYFMKSNKILLSLSPIKSKMEKVFLLWFLLIFVFVDVKKKTFKYYELRRMFYLSRIKLPQHYYFFFYLECLKSSIFF